MYVIKYELIKITINQYVMRHTLVLEWQNCRKDVKVLQYIMGHAHIDVTMEVYNHIGELARIENEIARWIVWR